MPYANEEIREMYYFMLNTTYNSNSTENMINKLQSLNGKTKLKFYKNVSNHHDEMKYRRQRNTFQFEEDLFSKNFQGIRKIYHDF